MSKEAKTATDAEVAALVFNFGQRGAARELGWYVSRVQRALSRHREALKAEGERMAAAAAATHLSDCATHNEPAMPAEPCDCEAVFLDSLSRGTPGGDHLEGFAGLIESDPVKLGSIDDMMVEGAARGEIVITPNDADPPLSAMQRFIGFLSGQFFHFRKAPNAYREHGKSAAERRKAKAAAAGRSVASYYAGIGA